MRTLLVLALAASLPAAPQSARRAKPRTPAAAKPAPANAWPIGSLAVEGNKDYAAADVLKVAGLGVGQVAGKSDFDAARDRILATGVFDRVDYRFEPAPGDPSKFAAVFTVTEIPERYPFRTEELGVPDAAVRDWLKREEPLFAPRIPATKGMLARYSKSIERLLAKEGHPSNVVGRLSPEGANGEMVVVFYPASLPSVAEVYFKGNQLIDTQTLQRAMVGAGVGAIYTERRFREILDHSMRPLYEAKGRLALKFARLETARAKNVEGIAVTVTLDEGPEYKLGKVRASGTPNAAELAKDALFKPGEIANFDEIGSNIEFMLRALRKDGYIRASADTERHVNDKDHTVDLNIHLTAGPQFTMGKLTINGLDIQSEPQVRKLWAIREGKPFDSAYPDFFLKRLREGNYFENLGKTASAVKIDEGEHRADVTLSFGKGGELPVIGPAADQREEEKRRRRQQR